MPDGLNAAQREAVLHGGGPLLVFAGAGSGKTRTITHRVAELLGRGVPPTAIMALTFTNKAAAEMRERVLHLVRGSLRGLSIGTFHSTCARLLRDHAEVAGVARSFTIYDDQDQQTLLRWVIRDLELDDQSLTPRQVAGEINRAKQMLVGPNEFEARGPVGAFVASIYSHYEARKANLGALDFGDLIYRMARALSDTPALADHLGRRYEHILVDEFQDTNYAQLRLVQSLAAVHRNLYVVGDDDQSIYRWRGAERRHILDFRRAFPDARIVKLEQNYRSTQRILRIANAVIERSVDREPKTLWTDNEDGGRALVLVCRDERDEARTLVASIQMLLEAGEHASEIGVLYRVHAQSRAIEEALRAENLPYRIVGGTRFYDRAEIKDAIAYLRVLLNPSDDLALARIVNVPARGIGKTTVDRLHEDAARRGGGLWDALRRASQDTAHRSRKRLAAFIDVIEELRGMLDDGANVSGVTAAMLERSGYELALLKDPTPEGETRLQNVRELVGSIRVLEEELPELSLAEYLERVTLATSADDSSDQGCVTLTTVHAAKGLEYETVIVAGLEEELFPFCRPDQWVDPEELEEERRLAYVAFTRARQRLILSLTQQRVLFGRVRYGLPSRFLLEMPSADLQLHGAAAPWLEQLLKGQSHSLRAAPPPEKGSWLDTSEGCDWPIDESP